MEQSQINASAQKRSNYIPQKLLFSGYTSTTINGHHSLYLLYKKGLQIKAFSQEVQLLAIVLFMTRERAKFTGQPFTYDKRARDEIYRPANLRMTRACDEIYRPAKPTLQLQSGKAISKQAANGM